METNNNTVFSAEDRIAARKQLIKENRLMLPTRYNKKVVRNGKVEKVSACFFLNGGAAQAADYVTRLLYAN